MTGPAAASQISTQVKVLITIAFLLAASWYFALRIITITPTGKPTSAGGYPECPHDWSVAIRNAPKASDRDDLLSAPVGATPPSGGQLSVPERTTNIPEFHDCQRLRIVDAVTGEVRFGDIAAVFARDTLDSIPQSAFHAGLTAAVVFLPQGGSYPQLGITTTYSCVLLKVTGGVWDAWMIPVAEELACDNPIPASELRPERLLQVKLTTAESLKLDPVHIPGVARWDWDAARKEHYLGVRCGPAWCSIGRQGFTASTGYPPVSSEGVLTRRTLAVRGWYDEQYLAEYEAGKPVPSGNLGTVVPTAELAGFSSSPIETGVWAKVAHVYAQGASDSYESEFNFVKSAGPPPKEPRSTLYICASDAVHRCNPLQFLRRFKSDACDEEAGRRWYGLIRSPGKDDRYVCVVFRGHNHDFTIPPVARWRWRENDETVWISCPTGCCELNGDQ